MKLVFLLMALGAGATPTMFPVAPGEDIAVFREGPTDGPVAILVPGLSGCHFGFRKLTPMLHEQGLQTIVIEPLAVGDSSRPGDHDYTITAQSARIGAVMDSLGIDQAVFVAQGIGGAMVFRLAVERPDLVTGLISIEAAASEEAMTPDNKKNLMMAKAVIRLGGKSILRKRYLEILKKSSGDTSWLDRRTVGRYYRGIGRDPLAAMEALTNMTEQAEPWAMVPRLPEIMVPVMVLLGTAPHEGELDSQAVLDLDRGLRNVEFREVAGAGHFIYEENPQAVADAVRDLVQKLPAGRVPSGAALVSGDNGGTDLVQPSDRR